MEWHISINDCNDNWQRQIYQSAHKQGFNAFKDAIKSIHFWIADVEEARCSEDHQLWPCPTIRLVMDENDETI